ncbi:DUF3566 domain-containing protein [Corynebacterium guangdongense]|uniref:Membrane protein n=1 Tax=Corynebacterium guangdongense TaxID=1783348 RepID=A0ABU2A0A4_9CORY|nr:DUF3566 domain-containing protein [Corynebacterium guangdongense]MDR7330617.1 putative membrane protein [Corynebacterium guangdongense]WJZ16633.1 hypothetical protein CGUA_00105 [Corynebacterium guangdongense]
MAARTVTVTRVSPLSAFKVGGSLALVGLAAWLIMVALLYAAMGQAGIWESANSLIGGVGGERGVTFGLVMSVAVLMGSIFAILLAILAPLAALVYNAVHKLMGGLEVELRD